MKLIEPSFSILEQAPGIEGMYKHIELAGRTCYKSEDKITEDSAKGFVERMIQSGHGAMLEHGTVYLKVPNGKMYRDGAFRDFNEVFTDNLYYKICSNEGIIYITTNYRYIIENHLEHWLKYICKPTEYHERRITVRYTSDIHFYKDTTRHRVFSWAIESTRFCNYLKEKFGASISFLIPCWLKPEEQEEFEEDLKTIENIYFKWINKGWQAQQAAYFLIQGTKAEIIMTGFMSDYKHFFDLRSELAVTGKPHPTVMELVEPLRQEFIKRNWV